MEDLWFGAGSVLLFVIAGLRVVLSRLSGLKRSIALVMTCSPRPKVSHFGKGPRNIAGRRTPDAECNALESRTVYHVYTGLTAQHSHGNRNRCPHYLRTDRRRPCLRLYQPGFDRCLRPQPPSPLSRSAPRFWSLVYCLIGGACTQPRDNHISLPSPFSLSSISHPDHHFVHPHQHSHRPAALVRPAENPYCCRSISS